MISADELRTELKAGLDDSSEWAKVPRKYRRPMLKVAWRIIEGLHRDFSRKLKGAERDVATAERKLADLDNDERRQWLSQAQIEDVEAIREAFEVSRELVKRAGPEHLSGISSIVSSRIKSAEAMEALERRGVLVGDGQADPEAENRYRTIIVDQTLDMLVDLGVLDPDDRDRLPELIAARADILPALEAGQVDDLDQVDPGDDGR